MAISPDHQRITDLLVKDIEGSGLTADEKNNLVTSLQGALESTNGLTQEETTDPLTEYVGLVEYRRYNPLPEEEYGEEHHIIPRSCGGTDAQWNIVKMSASEHYTAHKLLCDVYPTGTEHRSMVFAWNMMGNRLGIKNADDYARFREELAQNLSEAQKRHWEDPEYRERQQKNLDKLHQDPEVKRKRSEAIKARCQDPEVRRQISEAAKKRSQNPEWKRKQFESHKGYKHSEEAKKHYSERSVKQWSDPQRRIDQAENMRDRWKDPEYRDKVVKSMRGKKKSEETRRRMSEAAKKRAQDPEYIRKQSESHKRYHAEKRAMEEKGIIND